MQPWPLEWKKVGDFRWNAHSAIGSYCVRSNPDGSNCLYYMPMKNSWEATDWLSCDSIEHGISLCQDDYGRRIGALFDSVKGIVSRATKNAESPVVTDAFREAADIEAATPIAAGEMLLTVGAQPEPLALDVSLERARALHRVWRALNDGDCPKCHKHRPANSMVRDLITRMEGVCYPVHSPGAIQCPECRFVVTGEEIAAIEEMFAPAMDAAVAIFEEWRSERAAKGQS